MHPEGVILTSLGGTAVRGYIGTVEGVRLIVFVYNEGPYKELYATTAIPLPSQLAVAGLEPEGARADPPWYRSFEIAFQFPIRYHPGQVERLLSAISPWVSEGPATVYPSDIPADEARLARISSSAQGEQSPLSLHLDSTELRTLIGARYIEEIRAQLRLDNRRVRVLPSVEGNDINSIHVEIALHPEEALREPGYLASKLLGEKALFAALNQVDPIYASMGVDSTSPSLSSILSRRAILPYSGYYGSRLVSIMGNPDLLKALGDCPKFELLPAGGIFVCWDWTSSQVFQSRSFQEYMARLRQLQQRIPAKL